ncbi:MAG: hypothetical protein WB792_10410, partial [Desulfobacterales bacterium]
RSLIMKQLFDAGLEIVVASDFIYFPLLFDPDIEKEIQTVFCSGETTENSNEPESKLIIKLNDKHFVKGFRIGSLVKNYESIDPHSYHRMKNECLRRYQLMREVDGIFLDGPLRTILFQVMPHFIKKNKGLSRKKLSDEAILDLIGQKIKVPESYCQEAKTFMDIEPLKEILRNIENQTPILELPENGLMSGRKLRDWFRSAVHAKVLADEVDRITKSIQVRQQFSRIKPEHIATLLYITDTGSMEIDGFGFIRINADRKEYHIYKHSGDYILKDYYDRGYLFPDCRVAVSTYTPFRPFVMEKYKHPFLLGHKSGQEICIKQSNPPDEMTAKHIINALEEGLTALRYGYDPRRRNGYHSLDQLWVHIPTIDFEDYRI